MTSKKSAPSPLQDAIRAQQAVVNQLADEHAEAHNTMTVKGEQLRRAHADLTALLIRQAAQ